MKTITLTKSESAAGAAGELVVWRRLHGTTEHKGPYNPAYIEVHQHDKGWQAICPYGKPGDEVWLVANRMVGLCRLRMDSGNATIAAIRVTKRGAVWGWELELEERNG